ncbi:unnamed protein product [Rotaria sp. Silwood2]|nr:unnamed protein product [Rotaria sp. Silwood2]
MTNILSIWTLVGFMVVNILVLDYVRGDINWNGNNWAMSCDFRGSDLSNVQVASNLCGGKCVETQGCTHFTWTQYNGGTCWMKYGIVSKSDAFATTDTTMICGVNNGDPNVNRTNRTMLNSLREDIKSGRKPIRGVNLGGWLVAEHWMTTASPAWNGVPDDIANQGEYQTMQHLGHSKGDSQFKQHRDSFITEQDFRDIAVGRMNVVRIPVGYWITGFDNSGGGDLNGWRMFAPNAIDYLDRAIREWAPRYNILVLISFHAAKGSQNGMDHSAPSDPGKSHWGNYPENVKNTLDAVEWLARRYKDDTAFLGIGLLNEPSGTTPESVLKQYYYDAYGRIRLFSDCLLVIAPLLQQQGPYDSDWNNFMRWPNFYNLRHEWHRYQIWGFEGWDENRLIAYAQNELKNGISQWTGNWVFIGEWCIASSASFSNDYDLHRYAQAQLEAFNSAPGGWTFWTWKFYNDDGSRNGWSLKSMINRGFIQV